MRRGEEKLCHSGMPNNKYRRNDVIRKIASRPPFQWKLIQISRQWKLEVESESLRIGYVHSVRVSAQDTY